MGMGIGVQRDRISTRLFAIHLDNRKTEDQRSAHKLIILLLLDPSYNARHISVFWFEFRVIICQQNSLL